MPDLGCLKDPFKGKNSRLKNASILVDYELAILQII